jgi:hypothetical protein
MRKLPFFALIVSSVVVAFSGIALAQFVVPVPEIPVPGLPDISMAAMTPTGPVQYYNPVTCTAVGFYVCGFFRAHEYGHIFYGDVLTGVYPPMAEARADCFAAKQVPQTEAIAAVQFFTAQGAAGDMTHGDGYVRAARIRSCAGLP